MRPALAALLALVLLSVLPVGVSAEENMSASRSNPFFVAWRTPFGAPPFARLLEEHYLPAFRESMARHKQEIAAIARSREAPTFENTIAALDDAGELLDRVSDVFFGLKSAHSTDGLQAIAKEVAPLLSQHEDDIYLDEELFARVKTVGEQRDKLRLDPEQRRLLEETYKSFVRGGALLDGAGKQRLRAINEELAVLAVKFEQNLLKETNAYALVIARQQDLAGLPAGVVAAAAEEARHRGQPGKWVFTLQAPSIWPFLRYAKHRELRRQILTAYLSRCDRGNTHDNNKVISRMAALRQKKARLLGYQSWAEFVLAERMAKTPTAVSKLLEEVWRPTLQVARREAAELQAEIKAEGGTFSLEPWDWRYYAEKVRKARYAVDEEVVRPYLALDRVREGAFTLAGRLYGLTFTERKDVPTYHPEVRVFEVRESSRRPVGLILLDYHPRASKKVGAWMSSYRRTWRRKGRRVLPVVVNVGNFARPTGETPALLNLEEMETLFHEFGHALHALLSACRYRGLSGTQVARDFVELPSQIMENWVLEPELLRSFARHYATGEVIPAELIEKIRKAREFNQGFETLEYLAAAKLDLAWHTIVDDKERDAAAFERVTLQQMGLLREIPVRYRSPYFAHITGGYSAGYYSYLWSEVLDADAFELFKERGLFHRPTATAFRKHVLERGNSEDPMSLYLRFRGREPSVEPMLHRRGLR